MIITPDDMAGRTARFKELSYSSQGYLDTRMPAHKRNTYNVIGRGVTEDDKLKPAITEAEGFNITYIGAELFRTFEFLPVPKCFLGLGNRNIISISNGPSNGSPW